MAFSLRFYYVSTTFKAILLRCWRSLYVTQHFMPIFGNVVETPSSGMDQRSDSFFFFFFASHVHTFSGMCHNLSRQDSFIRFCYHDV